MRKNFPDEVRKSFLRSKKWLNRFSRQIKCVNRFRDQKVHKIAIWSPSLKCMGCFCNIVTILWWHNHTSLMHKLQTFGLIKDFMYYPETFQIVRKLSRISGNFPDHPDTFQIIRKPSRLSGNFLDCLETFQILWRSGNFLDYPQTFQNIRKLPTPSGHFPDYPETFQTFRKLSRLSGNFPDSLEIFQAIRKLSGPSG